MTGKEVKVFLYICIISPAKKNLQNLFFALISAYLSFLSRVKKTEQEEENKGKK
jgi:hypothetical protein